MKHPGLTVSWRTPTGCPLAGGGSSAHPGLLQNGLAVADGHVGAGRTVFLHLPLLLFADPQVTC